MNDLDINNSVFERIKNVDENGHEYWSARDLQGVLNYKEWSKFKGTIDKAIVSCSLSSFEVNDHFVEADKMVQTGDSQRKILDYKLSRYACYLIAQNSDSRKKVVALTQTNAKLIKDDVKSENEANKTHYEVGKKIRETIKELGGTMPEDFPKPEKSIKELEK